MSQTPACPEVPDDVRPKADQLATMFYRPQTNKWFMLRNAVQRAVVADRASRALPSTALAARPEEDTARLDWLEAKMNAELFMKGGWDDDDMRWSVQFVNGGRNDREWTEMGQGQTVREAIDAAMLAAAPSTPPTAGDGHD